jgi:hypothetical protein
MNYNTTSTPFSTYPKSRPSFFTLITLSLKGERVREGSEKSGFGFLPEGS